MNKRRRPASLRRSMVSGATTSLALVNLCLAAVFAPGLAGLGGPAILADEGNMGRPVAEGSPAWLMERHGCWSGPSPADMAGEVPGHVVIRFEGEVAARYRGEAAVGVALEHLFGEDNPRVAEVHGFCR